MNTPPVDDPRLGQVLEGQFRILRRLGQGGMGCVYLAEQLAMERLVVIKLLHEHFAADAVAVQRFQREARLISRLSHPNVVSVFSFGQATDGTFYLVMEYLEGETLTALLAREGRLPPAEALSIADQVLNALQEAHRRGLVHRDLKPDNIMLLRSSGLDRLVKVLDFGIAKLVDTPGPDNPHLTATGLVMGTPRYMAPEQACGQPIDHRTDLYSLGLLLYESLAGAHPFTATTPMEFLMRHATEPVVAPGTRFPDLQLPPDLDALLLRALAKEPGERFSSASVMQLEVRRLLGTVATGEQAAALHASLPRLPTAPAPAAASGTAPTPPSATPSATPPAPRGDGTAARTRSSFTILLAIGLLVGGPLLLTLVGGIFLVAWLTLSTPRPAPRPVPAVATQPTVPIAGQSTAPAPTQPPVPTGPPVKLPQLTPPTPPQLSTPAAKGPLAGLTVIPTFGQRLQVVAGYEPRRFDLGAFLPQATALARLVMPDAQFYRLDADAVYPDGTADLTLQEGLDVLYRFRSEARSRDTTGLPQGISRELECIVYVIVGPKVIDIYPVKNSDCDDPITGPPRCTPAQVWQRSGGPTLNVVAQLGYWASGKTRGRWLISIGGKSSRWVADDCP